MEIAASAKPVPPPPFNQSFKKEKAWGEFVKEASNTRTAEPAAKPSEGCNTSANPVECRTAVFRADPLKKYIAGSSSPTDTLTGQRE
jgi:hypothetical protein